MKSNKAITLVALIITVIILLILSAITIDIAVDGKLFDRSKETVGEANNKLGEEQNRVDSLVNEWDNLETGTNGNTSGNEPEDITPPTVEVEIERTTSNSITINVTATDNESGMIDSPTYTYYIKKSTESTYEEKASNNTSSHIFTDLTQETTYDIKVEVAGDNAGNTGTGTAQATTKKVTSGLEQGAITFGGTTWSNNKASVTISTNTSYTIEYQVNSIVGTWTTITNGGTVSGLNHGDTVYARLTDGTNAGDYASTSIVDGVAPAVTVNKGVTTSNSIAVSVTASDGQSGMASNLTYTYYIKKSTESAYTQKASNSSSSYIFTGLTQGTTYNIKVEVIGDKAGNKGTGTVTGTTSTVTSGTVTGAITFGSTTWSSNKARITISTNTSYTIEYQVNSIAGTWTTIANGGTVSNLNHGDTVYARLTDGTNAGQHASASITDSISPTISSFTVTSYDGSSITVSARATDNQSGIYSYQFQYKTSTTSSYKTAKTTVTSNGTCTYTYTGLSEGITYNLRVIVKDKANRTSNKTANQTIPITEHNWQYTDNTLAQLKCTCSMCTKESSTGKIYSVGQEIPTYTGGPTGTKWVVFGAEDSDNNGTNESLLLTTLEPSVINKLTLEGIDGYNNGIAKIEAECKKIYGNDVRAMKVEDVNRTLGYTPEGGMYYNYSQWYTTGNFTTKIKNLGIWERIKADGTYTPDGTNTEQRLGEYVLDGYIYAINKANKGIPNVPTTTSNIAKNLVFGPTTKLRYQYWLASRGISASYGTYDSSVTFNPFVVANGEVESVRTNYFSSSNYSFSYSISVRPILPLKSEIPSGGSILVSNEAW